MLIYDRLRADLERDLARRLTQLSRLLASGVDARLVAQFGPADESLRAYALLRERLAEQARAAGLERAYVVDAGLRVYVDSDAGAAARFPSVIACRRRTVLRVSSYPFARRSSSTRAANGPQSCSVGRSNPSNGVGW